MEASPYESPVILAKGDQMRLGSDAGRKKLRRIFLVDFYLLAATLGAIQAVPPRNGVVFLLLPFLIASVATYLCVLDARILGRPIVQSVHWIMFVTWPLSVPIYLIYSRRFWGLALVVLHAIALLVVASAALHLAGYLAYGNLWFERFGR